MTVYRFVARGRDGRTLRGQHEGASEQVVLQFLRGSGLLALEIRPEGLERSSGRRGLPLWKLLRPRRIDVEVGLRQLSFLLGSGVPLLAALRTSAEQSQRRTLGEAWAAVARSVQAGGSFGAALRRQRCFPEIVVSLASVGEQTGALELVLERAADALEQERLRRAAVIASLTYPTVVLLLAIATVVYMTVGLIPKLSGFLTSIGRTLPAPTQFLVDLSAFMQANLTLLAGGGLACLVALLVLSVQPAKAAVTDRLLLRLPLVGHIVRMASTATLAHNLSLLLASGVRLTSALATVAPLLLNSKLERGLMRARERVVQGSGFADALVAQPGTFGPLLTSAIAVGETSGTLDDVLAHTARFHDERLKALVARLGAIVEPVILIVIGSIVGFVYIAFFMAIYAVAGVGR